LKTNLNLAIGSKINFKASFCLSASSYSKMLMKIENDTVKKLDNSIKNLYRHNFFKIHNSLKTLVLVSFLKGLATGLGWVLGATILVSFLTFTLSQIEFIPILGEWVSQLIKEIETFDR